MPPTTNDNAITLDALLKLCQGERSEDWVRLPEAQVNLDPLRHLENVGTLENPELAPLAPMHRAVYEYDVRLALIWGLDPNGLERRPGDGARHVDWDEHDDGRPVFKESQQQWAQILLNGTPVWQQDYIYVDLGAGEDGYLPCLREEPGTDSDGQPVIVGLSTTEWELSFVDLISSLMSVRVSNAPWPLVERVERPGLPVEVRPRGPFG